MCLAIKKRDDVANDQDASGKGSAGATVSKYIRAVYSGRLKA